MDFVINEHEFDYDLGNASDEDQKLRREAMHMALDWISPVNNRAAVTELLPVS